MNSENKTKIRVNDLDLYYGEKQALKGINMDIRENEVTALIGPSGCGKSTFLRCLNRMNDLIDSVKINGKIYLEDEEILNAIKYHTTGRPDMTLLEKIIFIADYIEEGRKKFDTLDEARKLAYEDIDKTMAFILKNTIEYVKEKNRALHPLSVEALEYYKKYLEE